jgi:hypothetical protein
MLGRTQLVSFDVPEKISLIGTKIDLIILTQNGHDRRVV